MIGIDANDLNDVFASRHYIMSKIGKIGYLLGCSEHAFITPIDTPADCNRAYYEKKEAAATTYHATLRALCLPVT